MRISRQDELLYASLLCGMWPGGDPVHRRLLFFVANVEFGTGVHVQSYQKTLENGVTMGLWDNRKPKGVYVVTEYGHQQALNKWGTRIPKYMPTVSDRFQVCLEGIISGIKITLWSSGRLSRVFLDGVEFRPMMTACEKLEREAGVHLYMSSGIFSALYDMGLDHNFQMSVDF